MKGSRASITELQMDIGAMDIAFAGHNFIYCTWKKFLLNFIIIKGQSISIR